MSIRSLIEINHDYAHDIAAYMRDGDFDQLLRRFIRGGDKESRDELGRMGVRVISQRHHADNYYIEEREDGFPAKYIKRSERTSA